MLDRIWPGTFVSDASLARAVSEIREALGEHSRTDGFLQTVHGFGYRFTEAGVTVVPGLGPAPRAGRGIRCWLIGKDQEFELGDGDHAIGREPGVAVQLNSPRVSRFHAKLVILGRDAAIEDLGSKNGTFVRGARIAARTELCHGDDIQIGPIKLTFRVTDSRERGCDRSVEPATPAEATRETRCTLADSPIGTTLASSTAAIGGRRSS